MRAPEKRVSDIDGACKKILKGAANNNRCGAGGLFGQYYRDGGGETQRNMCRAGRRPIILSADACRARRVIQTTTVSWPATKLGGSTLWWSAVI
jgi:hypothetical protein